MAAKRGAKKPWTVLVYLAGDNNLDQSGTADLLEMKRVGSTAGVNVVAEFDSASGRGAKRYVLRKGGSLAADAVASLGRLDTGDPECLLDFVRWGAARYPAERYALILWNHGQGWDDTDVYAAERHRSLRRLADGRIRHALFRPPVRKLLTGAIRKFEDRAILLDDDAKDFLDNVELKRVLAAAAAAIGAKLDVLGMDACLMSMAEVGYQVRGSAQVLVGSEQTEPGDGWPYDKVLGALAKHPEMGSRDLGALIVKEYLASYEAADRVTQAACDPHLHIQESIPAPHFQPFDECRRRIQFRIPVHGDGMMNRGHRRITDPGKAQDAIGKALIVMHNVIGRLCGSKILVHPHAEGQGFRETAQAHTEDFQLIHRRNKVPVTGGSKQVVGVVQVEARQFMKPDMLDQFRVRRPGDDIHLMPQVTQRPAEVLDIDALPSGRGIAAIGQQAYFQPVLR